MGSPPHQHLIHVACSLCPQYRRSCARMLQHWKSEEGVQEATIFSDMGNCLRESPSRILLPALDLRARRGDCLNSLWQEQGEHRVGWLWNEGAPTVRRHSDYAVGALPQCNIFIGKQLVAATDYLVEVFEIAFLHHHHRSHTRRYTTTKALSWIVYLGCRGLHSPAG